MEEEFYKRVVRRPLTDVVFEAGESEAIQKSFTNCNEITLYSWRNDWLKNTKSNIEHYGYFNRDHSAKVFVNEHSYEPIILVGAGPSLVKNIEYIKLAKERHIPIMASHHALMYMAREEINIKPDYVCVLDAGAMWDDYFAYDKMDYTDVPLFADQTCNTEQLKKWKGPVYFYKSSYPDNSQMAKFIRMEMDRIVNFYKQGSIIEVAGHAMGAMTSLARGIMNSNCLVFMGADYCFNQQGKFYPFDHKIDEVVTIDGKELPAAPPQSGMIIDIFGDMVWTNDAYLGFKNAIDMSIKGAVINALQNNLDVDFINATEGGALGSQKMGNSKWMKYMRLEDAIYYAESKRSIPKP